MSKVIDITNQRFGRLVVLKREENNKYGRAMWLCQCDCGNQTIVEGHSLRKGVTQSCGCLHLETIKKHVEDSLIDEVGNRYGRLLVLKRAENKKNNNKAYWECQCDCGNKCIVMGTLLRKGNTQSCGCLQKEIAKKHLEKVQKDSTINEVGNHYGKLIVLEQATFETPIKWKCKCECGNICIVNGRSLRNGERIDCGCSHISKGEFYISKILEENLISFSHQYTQNIQGHILRFDFGVLNNNQIQYLIEFDGEQHFKSIDYYGGLKKFEETQKYDMIKNQWCKDNNIPLIRIPYTHLEDLCIEDLQLETSQFII